MAEKEITEIDMNKYIVEKQDDLNKLPFQDCKALNDILNKVAQIRRDAGKPQNNYLVLNLDDDIDIKYIKRKLQELLDEKIEKLKLGQEIKLSKVSDIAVALVNAILKEKGE